MALSKGVPRFVGTLIKRAKSIQLLASRRYFFSLIFVSLCCAKLVHIYSHRNSLPLSKFVVWGATFFLQDALLILLARLLCCQNNVQWKWAQILSAVAVFVSSLAISGMAAANISFFFVTGAEIHWRRAHYFHRDPAAIRLLLSGLAGFLFVEGLLLAVSWFLAPALYTWTGDVLTILHSSLKPTICFFVPRRYRRGNGGAPDSAVALEHSDQGDGENDEESHSLLERRADYQPREKARPPSLIERLAVLLPILVVVSLQCIRPPEPAYSFLSCALPLSPFFKDTKHRTTAVDTTGLTSDYHDRLLNRTALAEPALLHSLHGERLAGFEDWSSDLVDDDDGQPRLHYSAEHDPLHISNLQGDLVEPLREALHNGSVKIKHVILIMLESTRADVFPLRKDSLTYDRIANSHPGGRVPVEVEKRLAQLTRTAELLTGTATGFENDTRHRVKRTYGGFHAANAFTTSTFTLKSIVGTVCGLSPLVADFNHEYSHHIYQPCLPHVLDLLNRQEQPNTTDQTDDFTTWPWHSAWMQSVTDTYDNQDLLMPFLGLQDVTTKETLENPMAKHFPPKTPIINYYGYADTELHDYLPDAIHEAERDHKRLFLTHITGTTHHPWAVPGPEPENLMGGSHYWPGMNRNMNRYLNSIGYIDKWLAEILQLLEDTGIANETLVVMAGDHALSLPYDGGPTPFDNPNIGNFHIPLLFSHPHLPQFTIDSPVTSSQILPTILDLLVESSSLDTKASQAAREVLPLYEGQSMIRPLIQEVGDIQDWQFTVMNAGGTWLAVRSATRPYRLIVPLIADMEWRFTDLDRDPNEFHAIMEFDQRDLVRAVEKWYGSEGSGSDSDSAGSDAVQWIADAAHVAQWWVSENWRRWEYSPEDEVSG